MSHSLLLLLLLCIDAVLSGGVGAFLLPSPWSSAAVVRRCSCPHSSRSKSQAATAAIPAASSYHVPSQIEDVWSDCDRLSEIRQVDPSLGFNRSLVSDGLSVTELITHDDWTKLNRINRYWRNIFTLLTGRSTLMNRISPIVVGLGVITCFAWVVHHIIVPWLGLPTWVAFPFPLSVIQLSSSALALLLVFRTNSSYSRFHEARTIWGTAVFRARDLAQQLSVFWGQKHQEPLRLAACRYLVAFGWCLKAHLRDRETSDDVIDCIFHRHPEERLWLLNQRNRPLSLLLRLRQCVHGSAAIGELSLTQVDKAEEAITVLAQVVGGSERLLSTCIPPTYTRHTSRSLILWLVVLPFSLVPSMSLVHSCISVAAIAFLFCGIDETGIQIEQPFLLLPLQGLAKAIQRDVRQALVPTSPPPPLPPFAQDHRAAPK